MSAWRQEPDGWVVEAADATATRVAGNHVARVLRAGDLVILDGPLGAGKTTFTQGLAEGLGVRGPITSPTFVIARRHPTLVRQSGPALVHVDAYRLADAGEVDDLDLDGDASDSVTVVEWGAGKVEALAEDRLVVTIERAMGGDSPESMARTAGDPSAQGVIEARRIHVTGVGPRWTGLDLGDAL